MPDIPEVYGEIQLPGSECTKANCPLSPAKNKAGYLCQQCARELEMDQPDYDSYLDE